MKLIKFKPVITLKEAAHSQGVYDEVARCHAKIVLVVHHVLMSWLENIHRWQYVPWLIVPSWSNWGAFLTDHHPSFSGVRLVLENCCLRLVLENC